MTMTLTRRFFMMAACVLAAVSCIYDDSSEEEFELKVGDRIPDFTVKMTDGTEVTGASLRNGVSLIMFFLNFPCVQHVFFFLFMTFNFLFVNFVLFYFFCIFDNIFSHCILDHTSHLMEF